MTEEKQPFLVHLKELRDRLVISIIAVAIAFIITYYFKERIFHFLMRPFLEVMPVGGTIIFTSITEGFTTYFKIALVASFFLASPVILYETWMFVAPGLYEHERRYIIPFIVFGSLFFVVGAFFCYFVVMPYAYRFFVGYAGPFITPMPSLREYMNLTLKMLLMFGLIFEMPVVAYYLARAGIINFLTLAKKRRYAIVVIVVLSAMISPPEIGSLLLLALPMYGLYEVSILIARIFGRKETVNVAA